MSENLNRYEKEELRLKEIRKWYAERRVVVLYPVEKISKGEEKNLKEIWIRCNALELLCVLNKYPHYTLLRLYESAKLTKESGSHALGTLISADMVKEIPVKASAKGTSSKCLLMLEKGKELLKKKGFEVKAPLLREGDPKYSDPRHSTIFPGWIQDYCEANGFKCYFGKRRFGEKEFDIVAKSEGSLWAFEICLSGTALYNSRGILTGLKSQGIDRIYVCTEQRQFLMEIRKAFETLGESGLFKDKVYFKCMYEFLPQI